MSKSTGNNSSGSSMIDDAERGPGKMALSHSDVESRAYDLWQDRGCADGSAEDDWFEAERELESRETVSQP